MENGLSEDLSDSTQLPESDNDQRVYFVPYRWWKDAQDATTSDESDGNRGVLFMATPPSSYAGPMKLINSIFNPELAFNLRREENSLQNGESGEVGFSGRDFALVSGEMWLQALKWHSDTKVAAKCGKTFSAAEEDMSDVYPLQLRLSVLRETNSLGVKVIKKDNVTELFRRACKIFSLDSEMLRIWDFSGQTALFFINDKAKFLKDCQQQSDQEQLGFPRKTVNDVCINYPGNAVDVIIIIIFASLGSMLGFEPCKVGSLPPILAIPSVSGI